MGAENDATTNILECLLYMLGTSIAYFNLRFFTAFFT